MKIESLKSRLWGELLPFANGQLYNMKPSILLVIICLLSFHADAQKNSRPKITGQEALSIYEDQSITILMSNLYVEDRDDWFYPWGFTMTLYPGPNYTFDGHVVTPVRDFWGKLAVQVTVHDGQEESNKFELAITINPVNDKPIITGHTALTTNENQPITIRHDHLRVTDPDNRYPDEFTFRLQAGNNYTVNGNEIIPSTDFSGILSVNISVNDGQLESDPYALPVEVKPVDRVPEITGQATLQVNEDQSIAILLTHLIVVDSDNPYPQGFTLSISPGENYTVANSTITPVADFFGRLIVPVTVSDGINTSKSFDLSITVTSVNDIPKITELEIEPIFYASGDVSASVSERITVSDADGDSIMFAEVGFRKQGYQINVDKLVYVSTANTKIRGVFDSNTGILTLLGQASPASYTRALRSVQYQGQPASGESKVITFVLNDGKSDSEMSERILQYGHRKVSLDIPTGFTPNGDHSNDTWKIIPLKTEEEYSTASIKVYNKQGTVVYESIGFEDEWDGRLNGELLPADTYFYTIDLNLESPEGFVKGLVTILR